MNSHLRVEFTCRNITSPFQNFLFFLYTLHLFLTKLPRISVKSASFAATAASKVHSVNRHSWIYFDFSACIIVSHVFPVEYQTSRRNSMSEPFFEGRRRLVFMDT